VNDSVTKSKVRNALDLCDLVQIWLIFVCVFSFGYWDFSLDLLGFYALSHLS
jgi:hypothetical protein